MQSKHIKNDVLARCIDTINRHVTILEGDGEEGTRRAARCRACVTNLKSAVWHVFGEWSGSGTNVARWQWDGRGKGEGRDVSSGGVLARRGPPLPHTAEWWGFVATLRAIFRVDLPVPCYCEVVFVAYLFC